ncbi:short chain dehydrogenase [Caballeronia temeraria]|uniref:Short chain dehydrogenase n=1 Tax=Caballeronia temeraria TaxID=1777137 RepID=A0A158DY07_9BURK|nr:SDR family oxidoreductase [Caballeronia temeraria]SAK99444.1 short chain dehydrogenase [Caballeronia temeraria]
MDLKLKDKVVVVTGGTSGIGLETARQLLMEGARVVICGRNEERLSNARQQLGRIAGDNVLALRCDVTNSDDVQAMHDAVIRHFGRVDGLVCNAGEAKEGNFFTNTVQDWRNELELKFFSYVHPIRVFADALKRHAAGSIVCVNSTVSTQPEPHLLTSSAARGGVLNLAKSLAGALGPEIRVNSVTMGPIASGQWERRYEKRKAPGQTYDDWLVQEANKRDIPLRRFGRPEEAAAAILFLVSSQASYITGARLEVSGGTTRHI